MSEQELRVLLAVAEHRLKCAEIRAEHAERNWADSVEAFYRLEADRDRIWRDFVPAETKARLEEQELQRKRQQQRETELMLQTLERRKTSEEPR